MKADREIARGLFDALDEGRAVVMATVVDAHRSTPRHTGARMLVDDDGRQLGTIGGGEMEARVRAAAPQVLASGRATRLDFDLIDPARGDPGVCGGSMSVRLEPFMPQPHLVVIGCGHVGVAVVELAHWLGFRVTAIDDRSEVVDQAGLADADTVLDGPLDECARKAGIDERTHVVLLTRNNTIDTEVLPAILDSPARSIGVMGSARRWSATREALADTGVTDDQLDRVTSPVGLDISAEDPAEIALSIMSQIVELRHRTP